jgi:hypothetical protein
MSYHENMTLQERWHEDDRRKKECVYRRGRATETI